jgi:hypothetical protein
LRKEIYEAEFEGNALSGRPRRMLIVQIKQVLEKGQVKNTRSRRACMRNLMKVEERCKEILNLTCLDK